MAGIRNAICLDGSIVDMAAKKVPASPFVEAQLSFSDVKFRTYLESPEPENPLITPNIRICLGSFTITNLSDSTVHITKGQVSWYAGSRGGSREGVQVSGDCEPGQTITLRDTSGIDPCAVFPRDDIEGRTLTVELELFSGHLSVGTFRQEFSWQSLLEILYVPGQPLGRDN